MFLRKSLNPMLIKRALQYPLTLPFYLPSLLFAVSVGVFKLALPLYAVELTSSYLLVGIILAGDALGTILGDVLAGMLLSRLGDKRVMLLGLVVIMLSMLALVLVESVVIVTIMLVVFGIGHGLYNVSRHMYLSDNVRSRNRGRAIALFGGLGRIGQAVGPALGGVIAAAYGLRAPFLMLVVFAVVAFLLIALFLKTADGRTERHTLHRESLVTTFRTHSRTFATAGAGQLLAQMTRAGRNAIVPLFASQVLGLDAQAIGIIVSVSWALDMTLFYPAGWIMDNLGRKYAIVPSFVIQAVGLGLIPLTQDFNGLLVAATIIGLGNGISSGTMMTLGSDLAPHGTRGEFLGVWRLIGDAGATSAPLVIGWIAGVLVLSTAVGTISGIGFIAAAVFAFLVPETLKK
jgi:MFS family permease